MQITLPDIGESSVTVPRGLVLLQLIGMLLGAGITDVDLVEMATECLGFAEGRCIRAWESVAFFFFFFLHDGS